MFDGSQRHDTKWRIRHDPTYWPTWREKWSADKLFKLFLYTGACFVAVDRLPNTLWDQELEQATLLIGILGIWRYSWWFAHAVRAEIYGRRVYPRLRDRGAELWASGWRPRHAHFMMTTFREHREVSERVIASICREIRNADMPATIWLGSSEKPDEDLIERFVRAYGAGLDLELVIIRQNVPGKRAAIGLVLRAMCRAGIHKDDLIVFMDGDAVLGEGAVSACAPLFKIDPELQAVTTDEEVIVFGPAWVRTWLNMRFAQRRLAMQSHALSRKVLTLTGRMSVFRAHHLLRLEFIRLLEADHLEHWLWGKFRFLSGDDKSTWYYMLLNDAKMLYVPDAMVYTIEFIEGTGLERMVQNFRRWSGNMLRNGTRAIKLGPRKVGPFIWWCVVDQRIAMWTMLVSPILAVLATLLHEASYIVAYFIFIAITRMMLSLFLYRYARTIEFAYPFILYFNQLINASVKVYCLFRLSKQKWTNRGNQSAGFSTSLADRLRNGMASYVTAVYVGVLIFSVLAYTELLDRPGLATALVLFSDIRS